MIELNERQLAIIDFAGDNDEFQTRNVFEIVGKRFEVERLTIARDLALLDKLVILRKSGKGRSVAYSLSPHYKMILPIDPQEYFAQNAQERVLINETFNFDVFDLGGVNILSGEEIKRIDDVNEREYRQKIQDVSPIILRREMERLMIELSWKSSQIEGNTYTIIETEALLKYNVYAKGHTKEEAIMILNHKKALEYILENKESFREITIAKVESLHSLVVGDLDIARNIRKRLVGITGTKYRPLDNPFQIREALEKVCMLVNDATIHPFARAMMMVLLVSYIQPFEDGNKRTARLMGNAILLAHGYCPLSYSSIDVGEYKMAILLFYEQNNISYMKKIFIEQFEFALNNYFL